MGFLNDYTRDLITVISLGLAIFQTVVALLNLRVRGNTKEHQRPRERVTLLGLWLEGLKEVGISRSWGFALFLVPGAVMLLSSLVPEHPTVPVWSDESALLIVAALLAFGQMLLLAVPGAAALFEWFEARGPSPVHGRLHPLAMLLNTSAAISLILIGREMATGFAERSSDWYTRFVYFYGLAFMLSGFSVLILSFGLYLDSVFLRRTD